MKTNFFNLSQALLLCALSGTALAAPTAAQTAQYKVDAKAANTQYSANLKLCGAEATPEARTQCRADAKVGLDKALVAAKQKRDTVAPAVAACADCAKVLSVTVAEKQGEGGALGVIAGGAAGALLGNQVGGGTGKDIATVAGAAAGAYAGKVIEAKLKAYKVWTVAVQYGNGTKKNFDFLQDPGFKAGDNVKNSGETVVRN